MTDATDPPRAPLGPSEPSAWVQRFARLVPEDGSVLDLACGPGRHTRFFLARGHPVTAVDRDVSGLDALAGATGLTVIETDLEAGDPWPLGETRFAGVIVTNYLWRPLFPALLAAVDDGGILIYETFAKGNERYSQPRNPNHLLNPGELFAAVAGQLTVAAYEHGLVQRRRRLAVVQRIAAVRAPEVRLPTSS